MFYNSLGLEIFPKKSKTTNKMIMSPCWISLKMKRRFFCFFLHLSKNLSMFCPGEKLRHCVCFLSLFPPTGSKTIILTNCIATQQHKCTNYQLESKLWSPESQESFLDDDKLPLTLRPHLSHPLAFCLQARAST